MRDLESFSSNELQHDKGDRTPPVRRSECRTALSPSRLPGLDHALNPYRGCGHGCVYCYAPYVMRIPPEKWSVVSAKFNIASVLARELPIDGMVGLGTVTDPYQPCESTYNLTRKCLLELLRTGASVSVLTKSDLVVRDIDILSKMRAEVGVTITTHGDDAAKMFEPGAAPPSKRLEAVKALIDAGIEAYVLIGPVIPMITDRDLEGFIDSIALTGANRVMVDRLNLRPGMSDRLVRTMKKYRPNDAERFQHLVACDNYYKDILNKVQRLCVTHGLSFEPAF